MSAVASLLEYRAYWERLLSALQKKRKALLYEKITAFLEQTKDPKNFGMRELAGFCDISVPTLYNYFHAKTDLLNSTAVYVFFDHYNSLTLPSDLDPLEQVFYIDKRAYETIFKRVKLCEAILSQVKIGMYTPRTAMAVMLQPLAALKRQGRLADWIDDYWMARVLFARWRYRMLDWSWGNSSLEDLRIMRKQEAASTLLIGLTSAEDVKKMRAYLPLNSGEEGGAG